MRRRMQLLLVVLGASIRLEAGFIKLWQLKETAAAPVLVVGRVVSVVKTERVPEDTLGWKNETWRMTAEIAVLRSYPPKPIETGRLQVNFLKYIPRLTQSVNGFPPPLPDLEPGQVVILPLRKNKNPGVDPWQLMADSGVNLIIPTRPELDDSGPGPGTANAFLMREIANSVIHGTPKEVFGMASYLSHQDEDFTPELMPPLETAIGKNRERWAEVATNLLAAQGIPRPPVAELLDLKEKTKDWPGRYSLRLAQAALLEMGASPETDVLLINTWVAEAPIHAWGSATCLLEFGDHPTTTSDLRDALRNDLAGSSYIAWTLARNGHKATLADALARALKVADRPESDYSDLQGAAALLRDFGSDRELTELAGLVRKYQVRGDKFYDVLWQYATEDGNPREARVLAVVMRDRRIAFKEIRYCDIAVGELERATGLHFGSNPDDRLSQALAWIKSQGL
jgi:hypothetical protein